MSASDRELLELAARAFGLRWDTYGIRGDGNWLDGNYQYLETWEPLEDDGDALRLAVKLQIQVTPGTYNKDEFTAFHAGKGEANEYRKYQQDDYASTRRAIVRAAAEIGRAMQ